MGPGPPWRPATMAEVVMFTTESPTWSTRSAKVAGGADCARACWAVVMVARITIAEIKSASAAR